MRERRATVRVGCPLPVHYGLSHEAVMEAGRITNLSIQGLGLMARTAGRTAGRLGEPMTVRFALPHDEHPLTVDGVIRWRGRDPSGYGRYPLGIEFSHLDDTAHFCLQTFVTAYLQGSKPASDSAQEVSRLHHAVSPDFLKAARIALEVGVMTGCLIWVVALHRQNQRLAEDLTQRTIVMTQLESQHHRLQQQVEQTRGQASSALAGIDRLRQHTTELELAVSELTQQLTGLRQAYVRVQGEGEQLRHHVGQLEGQRAALEHRLQSIPELRKALRQASQARRQAAQAHRTHGRNQFRVTDHQTLQQGNQGYLIREGLPTLTSHRSTGSSPLSIRVYSPEPSLSSP